MSNPADQVTLPDFDAISANFSNIAKQCNDIANTADFSNIAKQCNDIADTIKHGTNMSEANIIRILSTLMQQQQDFRKEFLDEQQKIWHAVVEMQQRIHEIGQAVQAVQQEIRQMQEAMMEGVRR